MTAQEPLIGATAGNYRIESLLGAGAMGQVFLGVHPQIGRKVAVKVLHAHVSANADTAARFLDEARAVNCIGHPGVVQVFDFGQLPDGRLYLVMEYLSGRTLSDFMRERSRMSLREMLDLAIPMAEALDAAHAAGVVHRDLKPDNIFLADGKDGVHVKIVDFGIAKVLEPELRAGERTATGIIMGTPAYMSPEQAAGEVHRIGPASDIYSLAIIVYRMLSGRLPFESDFIPQLLVKQVDEPPAPISRYLSGFPDEVWRVLEKALAKKPEERFPSAGEFVRALERAAQNLETTRTLTPFETRDAISFHVLHPPADAEKTPSRRSGFRWFARLMPVAVLAAAAVAAGLFLHRSSPPKGMVFAAYPYSGPAASRFVSDGGKAASASGTPAVPPPDAGAFSGAGPSAAGASGSSSPAREHRLRVETEPPGLSLVIDVNGRRLEAKSPFEQTVPDGTPVRIAFADARHADMTRQLVVTADVVVLLTVPGSRKDAGMKEVFPGNRGMAGAAGSGMDESLPGEDDTVSPMF